MLPARFRNNGDDDFGRTGFMKNYILDTTVLLHDAGALFTYGENHVIIPISVIEDVDHFKKDQSEIGRSARQTSRILDTLRQRASVVEGIPLDNGGMLSVKMSTGSAMRQLPEELRDRSRGNMILAIALEVKERAGTVPTIFVSKDINLRIKADALGLVRTMNPTPLPSKNSTPACTRSPVPKNNCSSSERPAGFKQIYRCCLMNTWC